MGRGDKKTKKGKIFRGSNGNARVRKSKLQKKAKKGSTTKNSSTSKTK